MTCDLSFAKDYVFAGEVAPNTPKYILEKLQILDDIHYKDLGTHLFRFPNEGKNNN